MTNKLAISTISGIAIISAAVLVPLAVNAETAQNTSGSGYSAGEHRGSGTGQGGGGQQASLEARANAVGMTATELTEALKTKQMDQIVAEKGISTADFQAKMAESSKARWEAKGLSPEEVQKRVDWQKNRQNSSEHDGTNHEQGGYGQQNR